MKVVVDTNCLLASIKRDSSAYGLYLAFHNKKFNWLISNSVLLEYYSVIGRYYSISTANFVIERLIQSDNVIFHESFFKWNFIYNDLSDNKFVDLAISSNADYLVTNEKHFKVLKEIEFPRVHLVNLKEFLDIINHD
jgi:putative PIN family toxin of toxin-antitoxin system